MSEKTEKAVQHISDILDEATTPVQQPQPPRVASDFSSAMKSVVQSADSAESIRQHNIDAAVRYQGSQAYEDAIKVANQHYESAMSSLESGAKAALKGIVGEMMREYETNAMEPLPDGILKQLQTFNMIQHPSAEVYERYQQIFQDYPNATEVLCSKYESEESDGYVPKYVGSGAAFAPMKQLTGDEIQGFCSRLLKNSFALVESLANGKGNAISAAQIDAIRNADNPIRVLSAVAMANSDTETMRVLEQIDSHYKPSLQQDAPEDSMERKYEASAHYQEVLNAANEQAKAAYEASRNYLDTICAADEQPLVKSHGYLIPKE